MTAFKAAFYGGLTGLGIYWVGSWLDAPFPLTLAVISVVCFLLGRDIARAA